nr:MAG TPA_asm: hypothetical protein [Caudoviricetes sp.]
MKIKTKRAHDTPPRAARRQKPNQQQKENQHGQENDRPDCRE